MERGQVYYINFYPRSPCGERPPRGGSCYLDNIISIHALLAESDYVSYNMYNATKHFYPRSPCGERQTRQRDAECLRLISIHALLAESDGVEWRNKPQVSAISIHALLAESDLFRYYPLLALCNFYPRSPCGERQPHVSYGMGYFYFYPRSPCGERPWHMWIASNQTPISIHALLAESDFRPVNVTQIFNHFYPRSPCGERLFRPVNVTQIFNHFYPRSPCGERQ